MWAIRSPHQRQEHIIACHVSLTRIGQLVSGLVRSPERARETPTCVTGVISLELQLIEHRREDRSPLHMPGVVRMDQVPVEELRVRLVVGQREEREQVDRDDALLGLGEDEDASAQILARTRHVGPAGDLLWWDGAEHDRDR